MKGKIKTVHSVVFQILTTKKMLNVLFDEFFFKLRKTGLSVLDF